MSDASGKYAPRPGSIPGVAVNLGGHLLVLAPLGLLLTRKFDERGKALAAQEDATEDDQIAMGLDMILASLNRNYPDMTIEALRELVDSVNVVEAMNAITTQSGMKRVTPGELSPGSQ